MNKEGSKHSRLDRFLVSGNFVNLWRPNAHVIALPRRYYYCPLILLSKLNDYGPRPFRLFSSWLQDASLLPLVQLVWNGVIPNRFPDATPRLKPKTLKKAITDWPKLSVFKEGKQIIEAQKTVSIWKLLLKKEILK